MYSITQQEISMFMDATDVDQEAAKAIVSQKLNDNGFTPLSSEALFRMILSPSPDPYEGDEAERLCWTAAVVGGKFDERNFTQSPTAPSIFSQTKDELIKLYQKCRIANTPEASKLKDLVGQYLDKAFSSCGLQFTWRVIKMTPPPMDITEQLTNALETAGDTTTACCSVLANVDLLSDEQFDALQDLIIQLPQGSKTAALQSAIEQMPASDRLNTLLDLLIPPPPPPPLEEEG